MSVAAVTALIIGSGIAGAVSKAEAAFPGTNGKIVFMGSRFGGDYDILSMNADGTGLTDLTNNSAFDWYPDVSSDGTKIAFSSDADGDYEIYSMNADGTGRTQLTHNTTFDAQPSWSPAGTKIVFSRGGNQLITMNADGSGEQVVEPGPNAETPEWSPDGTKIVFEANRNGDNVDLFVVNADGSGLTRLTTGAERDLLPDWSPDGSKIAFVRDACDPCYSQIFVMDADGSDAAALTSSASQQNEWPAWSPDGSKIVFSRTNGSGGWDLFLMASDGSGQALLTTGGTFNLHADWGPGPPSSLQIESVTEVADPVSRYARFEASIALNETFANPFDPDEITVDVTFTSPSGRIQDVPAFWYQPFTVGGTPSSEQYVPAGASSWRVRFAPSEIGTYSYAVSAAAGARTAAPVSGTFQATSSARDGFVRVDDRNSRYLRFDSGEAYVAVGHNVAFEDGNPPLNGTAYYSSLFGSLDTAGETWTRVWMTDFNRSALEWSPDHYSGFYDGVGTYSLPSAWRTDRVLELAEEHGIELQLVLNDHGQFSTWVNPKRWAPFCHGFDPPPCEPGDADYDRGNPYSSLNGGPVDSGTPQAFFSNAEARDLFKQRLRYLVGRYGAYTSLLAWELFNEVQYTGTSDANPENDAGVRSDVVAWHDEMSTYLSSIDPYDHLVTTSSWHPTATAGLWGLPGIDVLQLHTYSPPASARTAEIHDLVAQLKSTYGKPVLFGEVGLGSGDPENGFNPATFSGSTADREHLVEGTHLHNAIWAGALSESLGAYWWWGTYIAADSASNRTSPKFPLNHRHFPPLLTYLAGEDWAPLGLDTSSLSVTGPVTAVGLNSPSLAFLWVRDTQNEYGTGARPGDLAERMLTGATVDVAGMADGRYRVRVYDTWGTSGLTSTFEAEATGGALSIALPGFTRDLALKVDFLGPLGRRTTDAADEREGRQVHLVYAIPADGEDRELDLDGTIAGSVDVAQAWLAGRTGGRTLRLDTANGEPDITFFQLSRTDEEIADEGPFVRDAIEDELIAAGFEDPDKIYAVHYDGTSTFACGGGAWPPVLPGIVAALYLHGLPSGPVPCDTNQFAVEGDSPGYWEYSWIHELIHTFGFVAECAPNHTLAGHVTAPTNDLMYAGSDPWDLSDVVLDEGNDDYYAHDEAGCLDLADSAFLADVVEDTAPPGGTVTTDPNGDGPSPFDPLEVSVTTPTGGTVSIDEGTASGPSPSGYTLLGQQVQITAPTESAGSPLRLVFTLDPTLLPAGESVQTIQVFRDSVLVGECPGSSTASPNPCVSGRQDLPDGTARLTILTSQASRWNLAVRGSVLAPSCAGAPPVGAIVGTQGANKLTGTSGADVIFALGGDDSIDSGGGNDVVCAGPGKDKALAGGGNDAVDGGIGADQIDGGAGDDRLVGDDGNDTLLAGPGNDTADGGPGTDTIDGGPGTDTCRAGERTRTCEH